VNPSAASAVALSGVTDPTARRLGARCCVSSSPKQLRSQNPLSLPLVVLGTRPGRQSPPKRRLLSVVCCRVRWLASLALAALSLPSRSSEAFRPTKSAHGCGDREALVCRAYQPRRRGCGGGRPRQLRLRLGKHPVVGLYTRRDRSGGDQSERHRRLGHGNRRVELVRYGHVQGPDPSGACDRGQRHVYADQRGWVERSAGEMGWNSPQQRDGEVGADLRRHEFPAARKLDHSDDGPAHTRRQPRRCRRLQRPIRA
jgi:hypothetical protein